MKNRCALCEAGQKPTASGHHGGGKAERLVPCLSHPNEFFRSKAADHATRARMILVAKRARGLGQ